MENPQNGTKTARQWLETIASPTVLFYALPWLMVLLLFGTLAQRELGLYTAQHLYFSSWILWLGPLPLPGAYLTLGMITLCLLAKFLLYSPWRAHQAGIILTHLGVLILLLGGMVTAVSQKEGFMLIGEGRSEKSISDYHRRVVTIKKDDKILSSIDFKKLKEGETLPVTLPFKISVQSTCQNCRPVPVKNPEGRMGFAEKISLHDAPPEKEDEANLSGVTFSVSGSDNDGIYVMMEEVPHTPKIGDFTFSIGRAQTIIPFEIFLKDFKRELHPGTDVARGFSSDIIVHDGTIEWPYTISMNEPLRYKGYTFYQSSFSIRPDGEYSVLSVVQNKGRVFPYIASAAIFIGLLLHIIIRLRKKRDA